MKMPHLDLFPYIPSRASLYVIAGAASTAAFIAYQSYNRSAKQARQKAVIPSPLTTLLPKLSVEEQRMLPYPPDILPGARDVDSPYGSIRVYEFGPENGRKVVLLHGVSTPCISLAGVAQKLASRGCRVMLFDLFGRGYSATPLDTPHDIRLYTTQIMLALISSPIPWTGTKAFSFIGYSLGGGISAAFTSYFPSLVSSLVLIAPSGIIREKHITNTSRILYRTEGILPEPLINYLVYRRLNNNPTPISQGKKLFTSTKTTQNAATITAPPRRPSLAELEDAVAAETENTPAVEEPQTLFPLRPWVTVAKASQWQIDHHKGFIPSFISSIRHAPITRQHGCWSIIGARLSRQKANSADKLAQELGLVPSKVLVILGKQDPVVIAEETMEDASVAFGSGNVEFVLLPAGHEVPVTMGKEVADAVLEFWGEREVEGEVEI